MLVMFVFINNFKCYIFLFMNTSYILTPINEYTYNLKILGDHVNIIYTTIQKILKPSHIDHETNTLIFSAEHVISFKHYLLAQPNNRLSHYTCIKLIDDLTMQLIYLKKKDFGLYGFDIDDILTIDGTFILCSTHYLVPLYDDTIILVTPIKQPYFSNPELFALTILPAEISYKCCYYSLGLLIVFSLLNNYLLVGNELKTNEEINKILHPLHNTKIYWFLKRCLDTNISNRTLLLV